MSTGEKKKKKRNNRAQWGLMTDAKRLIKNLPQSRGGKVGGVGAALGDGGGSWSSGPGGVKARKRDHPGWARMQKRPDPPVEGRRKERLAGGGEMSLHG